MSMDVGPRWISTPAPLAGRYDDIWFLNEQLGWAVNGNGQILKTDDGGAFWQPQFHDPTVYFRSVVMANSQTGWAGCTTPGSQLFRTSNGATWQRVLGLPLEAPPMVCGLWALDEHHLFASGTNDPAFPTGFLKSEDGGKSWSARRMDDVATLLVDIYFRDERTGWIVGGRGTRPHSRRSDVIPVVLKTDDGGRTWQDTLVNTDGPLGEWGWKIQFVDEQFAVVACENFSAGAILISEDAGETWRRQEIRDTHDRMVNENLEGIGFLNRSTGWVGGWGDPMCNSGRTAETTDGGRTWTNITGDWPAPLQTIPCPEANPRGQYINRFRVVGDTVYASGNTVYKYTTQPLFEPSDDEVSGTTLLASSEPINCAGGAEFDIDVPTQAGSLRVEFFDRFAGHVRTLIEESDPAPGRRSVSWDLCDDRGRGQPVRQFMVRVTCDRISESRLVLQRDRAYDPTLGFQPHLLARA